MKLGNMQNLTQKYPMNI